MLTVCPRCGAPKGSPSPDCISTDCAGPNETDTITDAERIDALERWRCFPVHVNGTWNLLTPEGRRIRKDTLRKCIDARIKKERGA
jgi:hypothetical protein